jgi:hypothetical protein
LEDINWDDGSFEYDASRGIGVIKTVVDTNEPAIERST